MEKYPYKFEHWNNSGFVNLHNLDNELNQFSLIWDTMNFTHSKYFLKLLVIWWMLLVSVWPNPFGLELLYYFWKRWWKEIANYIHLIVLLFLGEFCNVFGLYLFTNQAWIGYTLVNPLQLHTLILLQNHGESILYRLRSSVFT